MGTIEETERYKMGAMHKTEGNGSVLNGNCRRNKRGVRWELCTKQKGDGSVANGNCNRNRGVQNGS